MVVWMQRTQWGNFWRLSRWMPPVGVYAWLQKEHIVPQDCFSTRHSGSLKYTLIIMCWHFVGSTMNFKTLNNATRLESLANCSDDCMIRIYKETRHKNEKWTSYQLSPKSALQSRSTQPNSCTSVYIDGEKLIQYKWWQSMLLTPQFVADIAGMIISFGRDTVPSSSACAALSL